MENLRFKFRAWDYENEEIIYGVGITPKSDDYIPYKMTDSDEGFENFSYYPESELMQYTGTKDKNGKDIYDGDLITGGGLLVPFELYWNTPSVEWWVKRGDDEGWKTSLSCSKRHEVVGNIYENTELLGGK